MTMMMMCVFLSMCVEEKSALICMQVWNYASVSMHDRVSRQTEKNVYVHADMRAYFHVRMFVFWCIRAHKCVCVFVTCVCVLGALNLFVHVKYVDVYVCVLVHAFMHKLACQNVCVCVCVLVVCI